MKFISEVHAPTEFSGGRKHTEICFSKKLKIFASSMACHFIPSRLVAKAVIVKPQAAQAYSLC